VSSTRYLLWTAIFLISCKHSASETESVSFIRYDEEVPIQSVRAVTHQLRQDNHQDMRQKLTLTAWLRPVCGGFHKLIRFNCVPFFASCHRHRVLTVTRLDACRRAAYLRLCPGSPIETSSFWWAQLSMNLIFLTPKDAETVSPLLHTPSWSDAELNKRTLSFPIL
jgi:hypothetical protein